MSAERQTLVVLGASGNLTTRLLLPGLGMLLTGQPDRQVDVWGVGRDPMAPGAWAARVTSALMRGGCSEERATELAASSRYLTLDVTDLDDLRSLLDDLPDRDQAVLYCALPPRVTETVCRRLVNINALDGLGGLRLALEKPFGENLEDGRPRRAHRHHRRRDPRAGGPRRLLRRGRGARRHAAEPPAARAVAGDHGGAGPTRAPRRPRSDAARAERDARPQRRPVGVLAAGPLHGRRQQRTPRAQLRRRAGRRPRPDDRDPGGTRPGDRQPTLVRRTTRPTCSPST